MSLYQRYTQQGSFDQLRDTMYIQQAIDRGYTAKYNTYGTVYIVEWERML